jgi:hypothetical protein
MPALPSGQHIAVDPAPLNKLLLEADSPFNAHHIMAIEQVDDLFGWLDVLTLKPAGQLAPGESARSQPAPAGAPSDLLAVPAGVRLTYWQALADMHKWSKADRAAMTAFVDERVRPWLADELAFVRERQRVLPAQPTLAGALAAMWLHGCHWLQDDSL